MNKYEQKALEAANRIIADMGLGLPLSTPGMRAVRNPGGGVTHLRDGQSPFLYYKGPRGELYVYTPWKDQDGNYWTWTYQPKGKGSRSGDPERWVASHITQARSRKTAHKRARHRYQIAEKRAK